MACVYTIFDKDSGILKEYTYQELCKKFHEGYKNSSDIVFSKDSKQDGIFSSLLKDKLDFKASRSNNKFLEDPEYVKENSYSPQSFINSGEFRINNQRLVLEESEQDYINNAVANLKAEGVEENVAKQQVHNLLQHWDIINEDAKELHGLLNSFNFQSQDRYDFLKHLEGTKFEDQASSIYDSIYSGDKCLFKLMRGAHKYDTSAKIIQGINLEGKLNEIAKSIIGHYDNLVIDSHGTIHIYNYVVTTSSPKWLQKQSKNAKKEGYYYKMALLKQILANNGYNVTGSQIHLIPIRLHYNDDLSRIEHVDVYVSNHIELPMGQEFNKYQTAAKHFIKSNVSLDEVDAQVINKINSNLQYIFPERSIRIQGIQKSVDSWIKNNYSSKWEGRIKKVDALDHVYELYLNEEFVDPILIKDPTEPLENKQIREEVQKYIEDNDTSNSEFLGRLVEDILQSRRQGKLILSKSRNQSISKASRLIELNLKKYITSYTETDGVKEFEWDLISNDLLLGANILVFKNKQDQIDVVCLSNLDLNEKLEFRHQSNILGHYVNDLNSGGLINFKSTLGNIEAIRVMTILNELLPQLNSSECELGELKILSTHNEGNSYILSFEDLNQNYYQEIIRVVKKNEPNFKFENNFSNSTYTDPLKTLLSDYMAIINTTSISNSEKTELIDLGFENLENCQTKGAKKVELLGILNSLRKLDPTLESMSDQDIIESSRFDTNFQRKRICTLYRLCMDAYLYYSDIKVAYEDKISRMYEYGMRQNMMPNKTYRGVVNIFTQAVDNIAAKVRQEYYHISQFTEEFYKGIGYSKARTSLISDQAKVFQNLYKKNSKGEILMEFRNPYIQDSQTPLSNQERKYLKQVLFEFARVRSLIYGFDFNFDRYKLDDQALIDFINKNKDWYFNAPLEKASASTMNTIHPLEGINNKLKAVKNFLSSPKETISKTINDLLSNKKDTENPFSSLSLSNPFVRGDGYKGSESNRQDELNSHEQSYFETNIELLLAHYLEKEIQMKEFNKAFITIKGILLQLQLMGSTVNAQTKAGLDQTIKMIEDFTKINLFNESIMEPAAQKVTTWLQPFRQLVSRAYIAGNITNAFRDTFEGMWQNAARVITKYQTDITFKDLMSAYNNVLKASFTSVRQITIIDELCKTYRLSNADIAKISDNLVTSNRGILNTDYWMYLTLRTPDFLNRMVLFIAKCMKDGCWEAFSLEDGKLVYNWRKDKRYSVYANGDKSNLDLYNKQRIAYFNAIRQYNIEHPDNTIEFDQDLPVAYSSEQIQEMRNVSNSIYGAYDKSMRAKLEQHALGINFAMFSTFMNGIVSNYLAKPGDYIGGLTQIVQETDASGNKLFMDEYGIEVTEIEDNGVKQYIYTDSKELVEHPEKLVPIIKNVPRVVQGIIYTLKDSLIALNEGNFKEKILNDPMQLANYKKLLSDLLIVILFKIFFTYAVTPAYKNFKKEGKEHSIVSNAIAEILYKSSINSFDGFLGPINVVKYLGDSTSPPAYDLSIKVVKDAFGLAFGDKTLYGFAKDVISPLRNFSDTYNAELKKLNNDLSGTKESSQTR